MSPQLELDHERRLSLARVVRAWLALRSADREREGRPVGVLEAEILLGGRPGLLDVLADVGGRTAHVVLGLRRPGEEQRFLRAGDEAVLGLVEDTDGMAVVVDALRDVEMARLVLASVLGPGAPRAASVAPATDDDEAITLTFDSSMLTVFPWPADGPHPGVELLVALDEAGFNHLAAPMARWQRGGRDLGVAQELLAGTAPGWALALTSLRDLYNAGGRPEDAGGDFGPEGKALGTMTARMHLCLDRAYGRRSDRVSGWVDQVVEEVAGTDASLLEGEGVSGTIEALRTLDQRGATLRTHGDLHLGRAARTDQGWVVADCSPGGRPPGAGQPVFRSPLCDVADMLWSFHHVAAVAAAERDPSGELGLAELARAWESYNRRAFLAGYLATPGIGGLVPTDREVVRRLAALFELQRAANRAGTTTVAE